MYQRRCALVIVLCTCFGFGCGEDQSAPTWTFDFANESDRSKTVRVEASILEGDCDGQSIHSEDIRRDAPATGANSLKAGTYGFRGRAFSVDCKLVAAGCEVVRLPTSAKEIRVVLDSVTTPSSACPINQCVDGSCTNTSNLDGGMTVDSGSVNADSGLCVPNAIEEQMSACGRCGLAPMSRVCDANGKWGDWTQGACTEEKECTPTAIESQERACGLCGGARETSQRTCTSTCTWGAWQNWSGCGNPPSTLGCGAPPSASVSFTPNFGSENPSVGFVLNIKDPDCHNVRKLAFQIFVNGEFWGESSPLNSSENDPQEGQFAGAFSVDSKTDKTKGQVKIGDTVQFVVIDLDTACNRYLVNGTLGGQNSSLPIPPYAVGAFGSSDG